MVATKNVPANIQFVLQSGLATLQELQQYYGIYDLFIMIESLVTKNHNESAWYEQIEVKSNGN